MKLFYSLLILLLTIQINSQWVLDYQFSNSNTAVLSLTVTDTNYCWLITIDSLFNRHVTKKNGQNIIAVNSTGITNPKKIIATDTLKAFMNAGDQKLYSTTNSGNNWLVSLGATLYGYDFSIVRNIPNFIAACTPEFDSNKSAVFISTNYGLNWIRQNIAFTAEYLVYDIKFKDANHIYAGMNCPNLNCSNLQYFYSDNGGSTWQFKNFPLVSNNMTLLAPVFNLQNTVGFTFAVGFNFYRYKTTNNGANWSAPEYFSSGNTEGMMGILNIDSTSTWLCATATKVFKTTNDGLNWSEMAIPLITGETILTFDMLKKANKFYGFIGTDKGKIYKLTETIPPIGIQPISTEIPKQYSLSQNYPNPFNPATKIRFSIPISGKVNLTIFDVLGRNINTIVNEELNAGTYETDFDAGKLPSGIYYYKIEAETSQRDVFTETKKMVLVK